MFNHQISSSIGMFWNHLWFFQFSQSIMTGGSIGNWALVKKSWDVFEKVYPDLKMAGSRHEGGITLWWFFNIAMEAMAHLQMVYLLKMLIFHGELLNKQMVEWPNNDNSQWDHSPFWQRFIETRLSRVFLKETMIHRDLTTKDFKKLQSINGRCPGF